MLDNTKETFCKMSSRPLGVCPPRDYNSQHPKQKNGALAKATGSAEIIEDLESCNEKFELDFIPSGNH